MRPWPPHFRHGEAEARLLSSQGLRRVIYAPRKARENTTSQRPSLSSQKLLYP
jgi:hypothetical protein